MLSDILFMTVFLAFSAYGAILDLRWRRSVPKKLPPLAQSAADVSYDLSRKKDVLVCILRQLAKGDPRDAAAALAVCSRSLHDPEVRRLHARAKRLYLVRMVEYIFQQPPCERCKRSIKAEGRFAGAYQTVRICQITKEYLIVKHVVGLCEIPWKLCHKPIETHNGACYTLFIK